MFFKRIYDDDLAQASYLIGCQTTGAAAVVDPRRDIQVYLDEAARNGLEIKVVTETHIHADYLSGIRELAARTGAALYLSDEGGSDWQYRFDHQPLHDGSEIDLGRVTLLARHTPGHTLEHLSFLVTDRATADEPSIILTGDFLFVGDLGRPDLLDEAAGSAGTGEPMARQLYASLHELLRDLPDYVQVWPGHGAGSACGKALGAVASSTIGYERRFAWWAGHLDRDDEAGFVRELLEGQPDAPSYFARMKRQNRDGPALLGELPPLERYQGPELRRALQGGTRLIDTRAKERYQEGAAPGSLHLPAGKNFATWAAWLLDPEADRELLIVLAGDAEMAEDLRDKLLRVGIDTISGYTDSLDGLELKPVPTLSPDELHAQPNPYILDVRTRSEYDAGHIPKATQLHGGRVMKKLERLPTDRPIVIHCQSGARSAAVSSALRAAGYDNVLELEGGYEAWKEEARGEPA